MLLALTSNQKLGLALMGGAFVVFALISAMLIPRYRPDFPSRYLGWFIALAVLFTVGMLSTVIFVAKEQETEAAAPGSTETTTPTETTGTTATEPAPPKGDATAGKKLFTAQGCISCHTFKPAGSSGTVGPDLDNLAADAQKANAGSVAAYAFASIKDPNAYIVPGFQPSVMPDFGKTLSDKQIADLTAFVTQGS